MLIGGIAYTESGIHATERDYLLFSPCIGKQYCGEGGWEWEPQGITASNCISMNKLCECSILKQFKHQSLPYAHDTL